MKVHFDIETRSEADLPETGAYRYASHPSTRVMMGAVSEDRIDAPVYLWINPLYRDAGVPSDPEALLLLDQADEVYAHNADFEVPLMLWRGPVQIPLERWRCTAAMARIAGLPESLEKCGDALGIAAKKDARGKSLIRFFSIPREDGCFNEPRDHREKWAQFCEYCRQDVRAEREIHRTLGHKFGLTGVNLETFQFTLRMNSEGIPVNTRALVNAQRMIDEVQAGAGSEFRSLTGLNITQRAKVLEWLQGRGLALENMQADTLQSLDLSKTSPEVARAVSLYIQLSYAAAKKVTSMLNWVMPDGRLRGVMKFHGAGTGRWSAGGPQIQNAKKPTPAMRPITKQAYGYISGGGTAEGLSAVYGEPLEVIASCIRHFVHKPDAEMLDADYNAIEARVICWLAKERDMLAMWAKGADLYKRMASLIYNVPVTAVTPDQRDMGKRTILGCFEAGTPVLTADGWKPIDSVTNHDLLWDGIDWVTSDGAVFQGCKPTINLCGVGVTPDHLLLCGDQWLPARSAALDESILCQALETGSDCFQSPATASDFGVGWSQWPFNAIAALTSISSTRATCGKAAPPAATAAPKSRPDSGRKSTPVTPTSSQMTSCVAGFLTAYPPAYAAATPRQIRSSRITGVAASVSTHRGVRIAGSFCDISYPLSIIRTPIGRSTGSTTRGAMSPATSDSRHTWKTSATVAPSGSFSSAFRSWRRKSGVSASKPTFDVVNCGPRHRFMILTQRGPMIVHNCGYGMGAAKFLSTCEQFGVACDAGLAERAVTVYRETHPFITAYWRRLQADAMAAVAIHGSRHNEFLCESAAGRTYLFCRLPSGRRLAYPDPLIEIDPQFGQQLTYWGQIPMSSQMGRIKLYGGKLAENVCQAVAADLMSHGARTAEEQGMRPFALIHDQGLAIRGGHSAEEFAAALADLPPWAKGLPLKVEAKVTPFYSK